MNDFKYVDYTEKYQSIMKFNKNKNVNIHQWYPFVEGYSKEFIESIIDELPFKPKHALEPFSGSGTTPVELQYLGIKCTSFEVNPFMHGLSSTKMRTDYTKIGFNKSLNISKELLAKPLNDIELFMNIPEYKKIIKRESNKNWIFDMETFRGILDIKYSLSKLTDKKYRNLFKVALASILLEVSNVYRNGKCMSYKEGKRTNIKKYTRIEVHELFLKKLETSIMTDIEYLGKQKKSINSITSNYKHCVLGDVRKKIDTVNDNSIDLVITSPPYLNSRDYTDTYMVELWMLDYIKTYEELRILRKDTLTSHVQVKLDDRSSLDISELKNCIIELEKYKDSFWNKGLLNMIKGYFLDLDSLFYKLYNKMTSPGKVYFNVANSAYYGVEIKVDKIVAKIAESHGFNIEEIRKARKIKPSSQQKESIPYLLEVVIVMSK